MDDAAKDLAEIIARFLGTSPEAVMAEVAQRQVEARARVARQNARYAAALARMSDVQAVIIDKLERDGFKMNERIWQDRQSGNIACMLVKQVFDTAKGRLGKRLTMVYPDGSQSTTLEKTISIKRSF